MIASGAFWFGIVVGFITYRTIKHKDGTGISDIASVIGVVGGAAVLKIFPTGTADFDAYAMGLAAGLFIYLLIATILAFAFVKVEGTTSGGIRAVNEILGD